MRNLQKALIPHGYELQCFHKTILENDKSRQTFSFIRRKRLLLKAWKISSEIVSTVAEKNLYPNYICLTILANSFELITEESSYLLVFSVERSKLASLGQKKIVL